MKATYCLKIVLVVLILSQTASVFAQNSKEEKYYINNIDRHWIAELPLWVPGFRGQISYGDFDSSSSGRDQEREFKRLNSDAGLEFYFVGRIAVQYDKLWIQADAFSGKVSSAFSYDSLIGNNEKEIVNINIHGTIPRLVIGYSVWNKTTENNLKIELIPYVGIRHVIFKLQSEILDSTDLINVKPNWFEPLIGLYVPLIYKRFKIEIQADYGGAGTKSSWTISNRYRYRISKLVDVQLGWNFIRLYHKGIIGSEVLESTIKLFGPTAGIGFRF